jgi:hypothetical protein
MMDFIEERRKEAIFSTTFVDKADVAIQGKVD